MKLSSINISSRAVRLSATACMGLVITACSARGCGAPSELSSEDVYSPKATLALQLNGGDKLALDLKTGSELTIVFLAKVDISTGIAGGLDWPPAEKVELINNRMRTHETRPSASDLADATCPASVPFDGPGVERYRGTDSWHLVATVKCKQKMTVGGGTHWEHVSSTANVSGPGKDAALFSQVWAPEIYSYEGIGAGKEPKPKPTKTKTSKSPTPTYTPTPKHS